MHSTYYMSTQVKQQYDLDKKGNHLTEQGTLTIEVYLRDVVTGEYRGIKYIKRAELAHMFHDQRVVGSRNGKFVIQF